MNTVLIARIQSVLTPDLLKSEYRNATMQYAGHCYVASETYYHLSGGTQSGLKPMVVRHEGSMHWYLRDHTGGIIDITSAQFCSTVPYSAGRGCGFLTRQPSKRAKIVMNRIGA